MPQRDGHVEHYYMWWVPVSYTTSREAPDAASTKPIDWITNNETSKTISGIPATAQWIIFNVQQTGYYRVNYEQKNWNLLTKQLKLDHTKIHMINRAQLLDDSLNLAMAGTV